MSKVTKQVEVQIETQYTAVKHGADVSTHGFVTDDVTHAFPPGYDIYVRTIYVQGWELVEEGKDD